MSTLTESTTTSGTYIKGDIPDSYLGKMWSGATSLIKGEALAPEVAQPALIGVGAAAILFGDYIGVKAGAEGKGPLVKLRKIAY